MFRCPRCQNELPSNARFCTYCGFNQTNARLESMRATQGPADIANTQRVSPTPPSAPVGEAPGLIRPIKVGPSQNAQAGTSAGYNANLNYTSLNVPETPQPQPSISPARGNSLTGRYVAEQDTRYQPAQPSNIVPQTPVPDMVIQTMNTAQPATISPNHYGAHSPNGRSFEWELGLPDTLAVSNDGFAHMGNESIAATNKAAEQWYKSWRDRQRAEAGPAVNVSRGQASVPEPLLAMQHSIARMRAIVMPKNQRNNNFGFWLIIAMMFCLFVGLVSYIVSTYLPSAQLASQSVTTINGPEPTLTFQKQDAKITTFDAGQTIHVQGAYFGSQDQIIFLLNTTTLATTATTDSHGSFRAALTIPSSQLAGEYALQAQDNHTGQHAFLDINVLSSTTGTAMLGLSTLQGSPVSSLSFTSRFGRTAPPGQRINMTNNSDTPIVWTASAVTSDNAGWLVIDDNQTSGRLDARQVSSIGISVLTQGLKISDKAHPYKGEIIFTVANQGQVVLPVQLQITDSSVEVVVTPNPLIVLISPTAPGTCQSTNLTLINLNSTLIDWTVKPSDSYNAQHIHVDNQTQESDVLQPSGTDGDSRAIQISCMGVQVGDNYTLTVYYNGQTQSVPVSVRRS